MNKTIRSGTRQVVYKVFLRCLAEFQAGKLLSDIADVYQRTSDMTGISLSSVRRIVDEGSSNNGVFSTPGKSRKGRPRKQLDDFDLCAIRQKVHFFYTVRKQVPSLRSLLPVLREDLGYDGSREHLRKTLRALGFIFKKCDSQRTALVEKPHIAAKREKYLKVIMENRNLPQELQKNIIYLDESYIHNSYKIKKCWQSSDFSGVRQDVTKGKRYIIIHAGSENGFVPNALLIFSGNNKKDDYHSEMNKTTFTKWISEKLIPNLSEPSIVVMDNAPYHSVITNKAPTSATRVEDIKLWLLENNIPFDPTLRKPSLLMLVKRHKPDPIYEIDQLLGDHGHTVVRLPPYHCDLNPIELIWAQAKQKIATRNVGAADIKTIAEEVFASITADDWRSCCHHVSKIEKEYFERGQTMYETIDRLIINLRDSDNTDSTSDSEYEEMASSSEIINEEQFSGVEYLEEDILD